MKPILFFLFAVFVIGTGACSFDKATHILYKGRILTTTKATIKAGELSGMKYIHAYRFTIGNASYDYWIDLNKRPKSNDQLCYGIERNTYIGKKYMYTYSVSDKVCGKDTTITCVKLMPEEYEILKFISRNIKEYNYDNRFTESSIMELKYWVRNP